MATILDLTLLKAFGEVIFPVVLVFALVFALLQKTKLLGPSIAINSLVAIAAAFMVLISQGLLEIVNFMIPWFVVVIIFLLLMILVFQTFGAKEESIAGAITNNKSLRWILIGVGIVIFGVAFANTFGQSFTEASVDGVNGTTVNATGTSSTSTGSFTTNITSIIFHPKVLGLVVLFIIAIFAVAFLTG